MLVIIGCGGHAREVMDAINSDPQLVHERPMFWSEQPDDVAPRGLDLLKSLPKATGHLYYHCAIGNNLARKRIMAKRPRARWATLQHATSSRVDVDAPSTGVGGYAGAWSYVGPSVIVGDGVIVNRSAQVSHDCKIGDFAHLAPGVQLGGGVELGEGVFLGLGAIVLPKVKIPAWTVVGAGSIIIEDINAHEETGEIWVGSPARYSHSFVLTEEAWPA